MDHLVLSCAVGTPLPCDDSGGAEAGVPGWVTVGGTLLLVAAAVVVVVLLLRRAARRAPWE